MFVDRQVRLADMPLTVEGRALSVGSDEGETPGEANMWHWLFELAYHFEFGGASFESYLPPFARIRELPRSELA